MSYNKMFKRTMNFKKNKIRYPKTGCTYDLSIPPKTTEIIMGINKTGVSLIKEGRMILAKVYYRPEFYKGTAINYSKDYCIEIPQMGSKEFESLDEVFESYEKHVGVLLLTDKIKILSEIYSVEDLFKRLKAVGNPSVDSLKAKEDAAELLEVSVERFDEVFEKGEYRKHPKFIASLIVAIGMQG